MKSKLNANITMVERRYEITLSDIKELIGADENEMGLQVHMRVPGREGWNNGKLDFNPERDQVLHITVCSKVKGD